MRFDAQELRAEQSETNLPAIVGYAALFDVTADLGWVTESIAKGAFRESLERKDDVRALFNHDPNFVLGRSKAGTLDLVEDDKGLRVKILPPDTTLGRDIVKSIERGDISQMSFGFYIDSEIASYPESSKPHFTILRASLFDVSPVTFPAYEETEVDVKSLRDSRMSVIQSSRRNPLAELEARNRQIKLFSL
jgi:HK97 family phage prohead protease